MPNSQLSAPGSADASWAVIQANGRTTRYRCTGRGSGVLLLLRDDSVRASALWPVVTAHLATSHRVLVPDFTGPATELGQWLGGFLDGIGSAPVAIIAADDLCVPALQVAMLEPERVQALVLVPPPLTGDVAGVQNLYVQAAETRTPLLLLDDGMPAPDVLRALDAFLAGGSTVDAAMERAGA